MAILAVKHSNNEYDSTPRCASADNPVDLVHLTRQSLGDRSLEIEILELFKNQSVLYVERLENATTEEEKKMAAHTILGSARGVGAWQVAKMAEPLQKEGLACADIRPLKDAVLQANAYISELLA